MTYNHIRRQSHKKLQMCDTGHPTPLVRWDYLERRPYCCPPNAFADFSKLSNCTFPDSNNSKLELASPGQSDFQKEETGGEEKLRKTA